MGPPSLLPNGSAEAVKFKKSSKPIKTKGKYIFVVFDMGISSLRPAIS
jgi:hypothetical protein